MSVLRERFFSKTLPTWLTKFRQSEKVTNGRILETFEEMYKMPFELLPYHFMAFLNMVSYNVYMQLEWLCLLR